MPDCEGRLKTLRLHLINSILLALALYSQRNFARAQTLPPDTLLPELFPKLFDDASLGSPPSSVVSPYETMD